MAVKNWTGAEEYDATEDNENLASADHPAHPPGLEEEEDEEEVGRTYVTISQHANERAHRQQVLERAAAAKS